MKSVFFPINQDQFMKIQLYFSILKLKLTLSKKQIFQ